MCACVFPISRGAPQLRRRLTTTPAAAPCPLEPFGLVCRCHSTSWCKSVAGIELRSIPPPEWRRQLRATGSTLCTGRPNMSNLLGPVRQCTRTRTLICHSVAPPMPAVWPPHGPTAGPLPLCNTSSWWRPLISLIGWPQYGRVVENLHLLLANDEENTQSIILSSSERT